MGDFSGEKIGILGGTFDPIHIGHMSLAKYALEELNLTKVILMPAYIPPHKRDAKITDELHRLNMTRLAADELSKDNPGGFEVSDFEINLKGASYTARTLTILKESYDGLVFILGADSFLSLDTWYHPEIIFDKAEIACACRDGADREILLRKAAEYNERFNGICHILHMPDTAVSSTQIRDSILKHQNTDGLICPSVLEYIKKNNLYGYR